MLNARAVTLLNFMIQPTLSNQYLRSSLWALFDKSVIRLFRSGTVATTVHSASRGYAKLRKAAVLNIRVSLWSHNQPAQDYPADNGQWDYHLRLFINQMTIQARLLLTNTKDYDSRKETDSLYSLFQRIRGSPATSNEMRLLIGWGPEVILFIIRGMVNDGTPRFISNDS